MSEVLLPEGWRRPPGYSEGRAASPGRLIAVAGQLGVQAGESDVAFPQQWRTALDRVIAVVRAGGGEPEDVLSLRVYVTDIEDYGRDGEALGAAWLDTFGKHRPAITMVEVSALAFPGARIEVEALASVAA
jgi:enamine deaminase RidA (YjgF/YER057c/UK114 family)